MPTKVSKGHMQEYDRHMLRSEVASLFWAIIEDRRRGPDGFALQRIADGLGIDKSVVSRWFSAEAPNWELNSVADIGSQLDVDVIVEARDRKTGRVFTAHGAQRAPKPAPARESTGGDGEIGKIKLTRHLGPPPPQASAKAA